MTKLLKFHLVVAVCFAVNFSGCKKKYDDALPKVSLNSIIAYGSDSVKLIGQVTNVGGATVEYTGFAFDLQPTFSLRQNQLLLGGTSGQFSVIMPAYHDSVYYFKCFAANKFGYSESSTMQFSY
jgi:hypothetical protein